MEVLKDEDEKILNSQVHHLCKKEIESKVEGRPVYTQLKNLLDYLDGVDGENISNAHMHKLMVYLKSFGLTKNQMFQIINTKPKRPLELGLIINLDKVFSDDSEVEAFIRKINTSM